MEEASGMVEDQLEDGIALVFMSHGNCQAFSFMSWMRLVGRG